MNRHCSLLAVVLSTVALARPIDGQALPFRLETPAFFSVQVENVDDASPWYSRLFLLQELAALDAEDGRYRIRILSGSDLSIELIERRGSRALAPEHRGFFKTGIFVDDIEAAHVWVTSHGVELDARVVADSLLNVWTFVMRDPEGNRVQFFQRCEDPCIPGPINDGRRRETHPRPTRGLSPPVPSSPGRS